VLVSAGALAVRNADHEWELLDLATGAVRTRLTGQVAGSADGRVLAVVDDTTVALFDAATLERLTPEPDLPGGANAVAFEPDGSAVWTGDGLSVRRWPVGGGGYDRVVPTGGRVLLLTPDARHAAVLAGTNTGQVVALPSGTPVGPELPRAYRLAVGPDGRRVATVGERNDGLLLLDVVAGTERLLPGLHGYPYSLAVSASGDLVAAGDGGGTVYVWDAATGELVGKLQAPGMPALGLAFTPDDRTLAIGGDERSVWLVSVPGGGSRRELVGHTRRGVRALAFSPDGSVLASSDGRDIRLWRTIDGQPAGVARVGAFALTFSPDGARLAAAGEAGAWIIEVAAL